MNSEFMPSTGSGNTSLSQKRVYLTIHGNVQGVGFRWFIRDCARKRGLTGWVRNASGGTVECVAEGEDESLKEFIVCCQQGPSSAEVNRLEQQWSEAQKEFKDFKIRI